MTQTSIGRIDRVNQTASRKHHRNGWSVLAAGYMYEPIDLESTRWFKVPASAHIVRDALDFDFPDDVANASHLENNGLYIVEGTGRPQELVAGVERIQSTFRMSVSMSDFALIDVTWWEPFGEGAADDPLAPLGEFTKTVHQFSHFDDISIDVPADENSIEGLLGYWPPDGLTSVGRTNSIGFTLQPMAKLIDIKIDPHHPLDLAPSFGGDYRMKPKREYEPGTTYQVSVVWEFPENQRVEHIWSFTVSGL